MNINGYDIKIIYSLSWLVLLVLVIFLTKRAISKFSFVRSIEIHRRKVIFNMSYLIIYLLFGSFLAIIWGVQLKDFGVFMSSVLAILGVGFFAQWSILSNLTASVILFFNHPVRIGNRIRILDVDFNWTGVVTNITGFYFFIETDKGEKISLPNSLVIQKGIQILDNEEDLGAVDKL